MTNLSDGPRVLPSVPLGMWMEGDMIPRSPGYVSVGSRRYNEWQTLAYEATVDRLPEPPPEPIGPIVDRPNYPIPTKIMQRPPIDPVTEPSPAAMISSITTKDNEVKEEQVQLASSGPLKVKTEVGRDDRSGLDRSMKISPDEEEGDFDQRSTEVIDRM